MEFKHSPLAEGQIRLLHLLPSPSSHAPLEGTIKHSHLHDTSYFEALSYTWGHNGNSTVLHVKDPEAPLEGQEQCLPITRNLSSALTRLRHPDTTRVLWIDQICINQTDNAEKSIQVPLIGQVYKTAAQVLVWLGEEDEDTALAFADLERTPRELQKIREYVLSIHAGQPLTESEEQRLVAAHWPLVKIASGAWVAASKLFTREFFQRVWVVQEVVLGREVTVMCGPYKAKWEDLATVSTLHRHVHHASEKAPDTIAIISSARDSFQHHNHGMDPSEAMFNSHLYKATDLRDKVYGTLGLLNHDISDLPITYTSTVEEVYRETAAYFIQHSSSLDMLSSIVGPGAAGLPSWVPDCRNMPTVRRRIAPSLNLPAPIAKTSRKIELSKDRLELHTSGFLLGEVDIVGDVHTEGNDAKVAWMKMAHQAAQTKKTPGFPLNFHRLICARDDIAVPGSTTCDRQVASFDSWCWWLNRNAEEAQELPYTGKHGIADIVSEMSTQVEMSCTGRMMMLTKEKDLALGPHVSQVGDTICWLEGCSVPVVLRAAKKTAGNNDSRWTVVGACYLQGSMSGPTKDYQEEVKHFVLV